MAYDEGLAERLRSALDEEPDVAEKRMFGGLAMMVRGNMAVGVVGDALMVRVGAEAYDEALALPHAHATRARFRPMKGFVFVAPEGFEEDADLEAWVARALAHVRSLPAK